MWSILADCSGTPQLRLEIDDEKKHPNYQAVNEITDYLGLKFKTLTFDGSYLVAAQNTNPLANTIRISLSLNFADLNGGSDEPSQD